MTPAEISLVRDSFRRILPRADQAVALFYARLFELDPTLRPMGRGGMAEEGRKLIAIIELAIASLDHIETAVSALQDLGAGGANRAMSDEHFATVGAALLWTLGKGLGPEFTPAVREAWTNLYTTLANRMIDAPREQPPGARNASGDAAA